MLIATAAITALYAPRGKIVLLQDQFPGNARQFPVSLAAMKDEFQEEETEAEFGGCAEQWRGCRGTSQCQAIWEEAGLLSSWKTACYMKLSQAEFVSLSAARSEFEENKIESEFGDCSEQWRACKGSMECKTIWQEAGLLDAWHTACDVKLALTPHAPSSSLTAVKNEVQEQHIEAEFGECAEEWRACKGDVRCEAVWEQAGVLGAWKSACAVVV